MQVAIREGNSDLKEVVDKSHFKTEKMMELIKPILKKAAKLTV